MYFVYIIYSPKADKFYIGSTSDIEKRLQKHNLGATKFTRHKGPWYLVHKEIFEDKHKALFREKEIKKWKSRKRIIREFNIDLEKLNRQSAPSR